MDIETKIMLGFLFCFVAGIFIGWYVTWEKYHHEEEKHEEYLKGVHSMCKSLPPPLTYEQKVCKVINELNNLPVDEYYVRAGEYEFKQVFHGDEEKITYDPPNILHPEA